MQFRILVTKTFEDAFERLSKDEKGRVERIKEKLKENPFVGKPLGYAFFREKKIGGKRLYFIIYEKYVVVLLVAYGGKKDQRATIVAIKDSFEDYRNEVEKEVRPG